MPSNGSASAPTSTPSAAPRRGRLLSISQCRSLAGLYDDERPFRSRIVMGAHGFGKGEYKYFAYPLPEAVARAARERSIRGLRRSRTAGTRRLGIGAALPGRPRRLSRALPRRRARPGRRRCSSATTPATTTACTRTSMASMCSRCRSRSCSSGPGRDFEGGEFVLTEQRPRMQSRAEVVPLRQGEARDFAVHNRPVQGTRGVYRVTIRHGVSRIRCGRAVHARRHLP